MGLDMYLNAKRFLWHSEDEIASKVGEVFPELGDARVKEITCELMYWRKANAIHKWFVDNVQEGVDECQESWVTRENLVSLLAVVNEVLADRSKAATLLPPQSGFFFGNTDIGEWYFQDLEYTRQGLEKILAMDLEKWDLYYRSSW